MKNRFIFIGDDGSLGYKHGKEYNLVFDISKDKCLTIFPDINSGAQVCIYSSWNSFKNNWIRKYDRVFNDIDPYGEENWEE
jgi:hypothetical protein